MTDWRSGLAIQRGNNVSMEDEHTEKSETPSLDVDLNQLSAFADAG